MNTFRFGLLIFIISNLSLTTCHSQSGTWTWMNGYPSIDGIGNYGIQGVPSVNNSPAARYATGNWTDTAGDFWIYSGVGGTDDLWKFDPENDEWAWMTGSSSGANPESHLGKGVYDTLNTPGFLGYGIQTWTTPDNHLWLFGGVDYSNDVINVNADLWQYSPVINQWAWMGTFGPINYGTMGVGDTTTMPGGRQEGNCAWTDDKGNLWLFGGFNDSLQAHNDIWEYNVPTGIWTWMGGSANVDDSGQYHVLGQPSKLSYPSGRVTNVFWKDAGGNFWLYGGSQYTHDLMFQDIWSFNPGNQNWTWVKGAEGEDSSVLGVPCKPNLLNKQGRRYEDRAAWRPYEDLIITYNGFTDWGTTQPVNELWGYKMSTNEWTKIDSGTFLGSYGTMGVSSDTNYPPSRFGGVGFTGRDHSLWLFGGLNGFGYASQGIGFFNDLWKYVIDTSCLPPAPVCQLATPMVTATPNVFCVSDSATLCAPAGYISYNWNMGDSGTCIEAKQPGDYYVTVKDSSGCTVRSDIKSITTYPIFSVPIVADGKFLSSYGAATYQWYLNDTPILNATTDTLLVKEPGAYSLYVTDSNGCATFSEPVNLISTGINQLAEDQVLLYPNPNSTGSWKLAVNDELVGKVLSVYDVQGQLVYQTMIQTAKSEIVLGVPSGVYWLKIYSANGDVVRKMVKL